MNGKGSAVLWRCVALCLTVIEVPAATVVACNESELRAAISSGEPVSFACSGTITLSQTIVVTASLVLDGSGQNVRISGGETVRCFHVAPGGNLTLRALTIANGRAVLPRQGGGIYNEGELALENCRLIGNFAETGGAIYNTGILRVSDSVFASNTVRGFVGGPGMNGAFAMDVFDQFNRCRTIPPGGSSGGPGGAGGPAAGGAIFNSGWAEFVGVSIESNSALGGIGGDGGTAGRSGCTQGTLMFGGTGGRGGDAFAGAIYNTGFLRLSRSTVAENVAAGGNGGRGGSTGDFGWLPGVGGEGGRGYAGAIYNAAGTNLIENSTIAVNRSSGGDGGRNGEVVPSPFSSPCLAVGGGHGGDTSAGGIYNLGQITVRHATIWNNVLDPGAGGRHTNAAGCPFMAVPGSNGIAMAASLHTISGVATIANSIVGNLNYTNNVAGGITDEGHNICSDGDNVFGNATSLKNTNPLLRNLAANGGPTRTMSLTAGSPALDAAGDQLLEEPDQRGVRRPQGRRSDIGAFEAGQLQILAEGANVALRYGALAGTGWILQKSSDLMSWQSLHTNAADASGTVVFPAVPRVNQNGIFRVFTP